MLYKLYNNNILYNTLYIVRGTRTMHDDDGDGVRPEPVWRDFIFTDSRVVIIIIIIIISSTIETRVCEGGRACARACEYILVFFIRLLLLLLLQRREGHVPSFAALAAFLRDYVLTGYGKKKKTCDDNIKRI